MKDFYKRNLMALKTGLSLGILASTLPAVFAASDTWGSSMLGIVVVVTFILVDKHLEVEDAK